MRKQEEATTEKCSVDLRTTLFSLSQNELWMCVVEATKHPEMRSFCIPSFFRSLGGSVSHGVPQATRKCHVDFVDFVVFTYTDHQRGLATNRHVYQRSSTVGKAPKYFPDTRLFPPTSYFRKTKTPGGTEPKDP